MCCSNKSTNEKWLEFISGFPENYKAGLIVLIQKMNSLLDSSQKTSFPSRGLSQKEASFMSLETNKEVFILRRNNEELKEWVLNLERECKTHEKEKHILKAQLDESKKENDEIYKKYESAIINKDYEKLKSE